MGCQEISSSPKKQKNVQNNIKIEHPKLDFKSYRNEIKADKSNKYYEVKLPVIEISKDSQEVISKYFFFKQNGDFQTKVTNPQTSESYEIKGQLNQDGSFEFEREIKIDKYVYKGKIPLDKLSIPSQLSIEGKIFINGNESNEKSFILQFPKCAWGVTYNEKNVKKDFIAFMKLKNNLFNGISYDDNDGFAFWIGLEKGEKNDKLVQQYMDKDGKGKCLAFEGVSDKINGHKIEGTVKNEPFGVNSKFNLKILWKKVKN